MEDEVKRSLIDILKDAYAYVVREFPVYYNPPTRLFTLLLPLAAIVFIIWWTRTMWEGRERRGDAEFKTRPLNWVNEGTEGIFTLKPAGRMSGRDWGFLAIITAVYAALAFVMPGSLHVPETYWKAENELKGGHVTAEFELREPVKLKQIEYFTANYHMEYSEERNIKRGYRLEASADGESYTDLSMILPQKYSETYDWCSESVPDETPALKYFRLHAPYTPMWLAEIFLISADTGEPVPREDIMIGEEYSQTLFDEQDTWSPNRQGSPRNGTYFDEIYHARAALELLNGIAPYENTHPPLGKEIIAAGIKIFGMNPFGWRFMGILFGILMLPVMYILLIQIFDKSFIAVFGTVVFASEFMHYTQTHIATIDTYNVFFVLLMFLFMHRWLVQPHDAPFLYTLPPLFLAGLSFGLGAASKWSSIYFGIALVVMWFWKLIARTRWSRLNGRPRAPFLLGTFAFSLVFFIAMPAVIYTASYIPYVSGGDLVEVVDVMIKNQISMFNYHTSAFDSHSYQARWYLWLIDARPICYYYNYNAGSVHVIDAWNNPILSWGGIIAVVMCAVDIFRQKSAKAALIVLGFIATLAPWVAVQRITFPYHYFPSTLFLILALCYLLHRLRYRWPERDIKTHAAMFAGVSVLVFAMFFPAISGMGTAYNYTHYFLQWFPSWPF